MVYELIAAVMWSRSYFIKPYILDVRKDANAHLMRFAGAHIPALRSGSRVQISEENLAEIQCSYQENLANLRRGNTAQLDQNPTQTNDTNSHKGGIISSYW